jgi:hypothetical protein
MFKLLNTGLLPAMVLLILTPLAVSAEMNDWTKRLTVSGTIELEAAYTDATEYGDNDSSSGLVLATAELALDVAIVESVSAHFVTLYKENQIDLDTHEGYLQFTNLGGVGGLSATLGKFYLPFGQLETNLVNDTIGLEMVSPDQSIGFRESAGLLSWTTGMLSIEGYVFNSQEDDDDELSDFGVSFAFGNEAMGLGIDYLSDISDSMVISGEEGLVDDGFNHDGEVSALSISGRARFGAINLLAEHIQFDELSQAGIIALEGEPSFSQIDAGFDLGNGWTIAVAYQVTDEAAVLGFPETRITAGISTSIYDDNVSVTLEYWHDEDYNENDAGTNEDLNGLVIQIAAEF